MGDRMNSRDLINSLLRNDGRFDRVGVFEHPWPELTNSSVWVEQGYPTRVVATGGQERTVLEDFNLHFDLDMYSCGGWFNIDAIEGFSDVVQETDEWLIKRNGSGAQLKWWKHKSGTPEHIAFDMASREIWERDYRPGIPRDGKLSRLEGGSWKSGTLEQDKEALVTARAAEKWSFFGHVFIWEVLRQSLGDITMYESLLLDPDWIKDFNRVYTDYYKAEFALLFQEIGLPDGIWIYEDLGYKNGLFASPKILKNLIFPFYVELVDFLHSHGLPVVLHSCGNITDALPMVVDAGFDALQPMEIKAGCDPFAFADRYADRLVFIGGLDVRVLETNERQVIEREVIRLVDGMKSRGARYVFHSDHSITPLVRYDSYQFALDVYRQHMRY